MQFYYFGSRICVWHVDSVYQFKINIIMATEIKVRIVIFYVYIVLQKNFLLMYLLRDSFYQIKLFPIDFNCLIYLCKVLEHTSF